MPLISPSIWETGSSSQDHYQDLDLELESLLLRECQYTGRKH